MVNRESDIAEPAAGRTVLVTASPEATREAGRLLGSLCRGGEVILLHGDLGSGKTCLVQGLAAGLGVDPSRQVTSPTFVLHAEYPGRLVLNHLDLYRLDAPASLPGIGIEDFLGDPGGVTAVEWPELLEDLAGDVRLEIRIKTAADGSREIAPEAAGLEAARLLAAWLDAAAGLTGDESN